MSTPAPGPGPAAPGLAALRARLAALALPAGRHGAVAFGDPAIDAHLPPGGLARGGLHEILADGIEAETGALAAAFAACLLTRLLAWPGEARPVLWIARATDLHPAGLLAYGLDPARLLLVRGGGDTLTLGAAEAALRDGAAAAVVAEIGGLPPLAARRLLLAAETGGSTGLALRRWPQGRRQGAAGAATERDGVATTRWHLATAPSVPPSWQGPGLPRWQVRLLHARGGRPGGWIMALQGGRLDGGIADAPHALRVVAGLADDAGRAPQQRRA